MKVQESETKDEEFIMFVEYCSESPRSNHYYMLTSTDRKICTFR